MISRILYSGSPAWPQCPRVSCCIRASDLVDRGPAQSRTWNASTTATASSRASSIAFSYPRKGSRVAIFTAAVNASPRACSHDRCTATEPLGTRPSNAARVRPCASRLRFTIPDCSFGPRSLMLSWCQTRPSTDRMSGSPTRWGLLTVRTYWWAVGQLRRKHASVLGLARHLGTSWKSWRRCRGQFDHEEIAVAVEHGRLGGRAW